MNDASPMSCPIDGPFAPSLPCLVSQHNKQKGDATPRYSLARGRGGEPQRLQIAPLVVIGRAQATQPALIPACGWGTPVVNI